ncbi:tyrosine-type recombinase/integrase [Alloalcanivorax xenomutans]|uniref:tyrosine-type recombinase/integrase n=1 Tax=Alloalcanivorax xenomutans TaxID=1094342 RepID=UPI001F2BAF02|nr:site-specific integrase [Alloalcanivorax xenomutans]MCE7523012.1 site-specific integrase [Alloalcanivorax xenomutans]
MAKLTSTQAASLAKLEPKKHTDGGGLYFCVRTAGSPYWMLRYSVGGKRREATFGQYPAMSLAEARLQAEVMKKGLRAGLDPLVEKQKQEIPPIRTVRELFQDWYTSDLCRRLQHPGIPKRIFTKEIDPVIGTYPINDVTPREVRRIIQRVVESGRPTIANDTLMYLKQLFRHGMKLDLCLGNPAIPFTATDAGGLENSMERALTPEEIQIAFKVFRDHISSFGRDNCLTCCLFLVLGVRKSELCEALWEEFDLEKAVWHLPKHRSKTGTSVSIPLPTQAIEWLKTLQIAAYGSAYVFLARRTSKRPHMGPDTLNRAISKQFSREPGRKKPPPNHMGDLEHFTVHDLRRTFRSLAAAEGVPSHVAERCLNHKLKGAGGIYDRYDYFDERKQAHQKVADSITSITDT